MAVEGTTRVSRRPVVRGSGQADVGSGQVGWWYGNAGMRQAEWQRVQRRNEAVPTTPPRPLFYAAAASCARYEPRAPLFRNGGARGVQRVRANVRVRATVCVCVCVRGVCVRVWW